jgi:hypothetical protein
VKGLSLIAFRNVAEFNKTFELLIIGWSIALSTQGRDAATPFFVCWGARLVGLWVLGRVPGKCPPA